MITIIYLVDDYGIAFKNKKDAAAYLRENEYNEQKLDWLKNLSEEAIVELINEEIREVELR